MEELTFYTINTYLNPHKTVSNNRQYWLILSLLPHKTNNISSTPSFKTTT
jgi:hypothetical protein